MEFFVDKIDASSQSLEFEKMCFSDFKPWRKLCPSTKMGKQNWNHKDGILRMHQRLSKRNLFDGQRLFKYLVFQGLGEILLPFLKMQTENNLLYSTTSFFVLNIPVHVRSWSQWPFFKLLYHKPMTYDNYSYNLILDRF